jgi:hypothetical protein
VARIDSRSLTATLGVRVARLLLALLPLSAPGCGRERSAALRDDAGDVNAPATPVDTVASLREIVGRRTLVGHLVRITGRCHDTVRRSPLGQSPRTQPAWLLESDGVMVFVTGTTPTACAERNAAVVTVTAFVAEDTLPAIGDLPAVARRFLVRLRVDGE